MILASATKTEGDAIMRFLVAFDSRLYLNARTCKHYRIFNLIPRNIP